MSDNLDCQVAVIGAGPAGCTAAGLLASAGLSVIILEKNSETKEKACAGGILTRALRHLPRQLVVPWEDHVRSFSLSHIGQDHFERTTKRPLVQTVMRRDFDLLLAETACRSGARLIRGAAVSHVKLNERHVEVMTSSNLFRAQVVIGADGVNSLVARECDMIKDLQVEPALVMQVVPDNMEAFRHKAAIDWNSPTGGYSWIFPKKTHVSLGAVGPKVSRDKLKQCAFALMQNHSHGAYDVISESMGLVPLSTSTIDRVRERVLLVGDAAALVDPFVREGITWSLWSGRLAAMAISRFLTGKADSLSIYTDLLEEELLPELRAAAGIARWFYSNPAEAQRHLHKKCLVWYSFCRLLSGHITCRALFKKLRPLPKTEDSTPTFSQPVS